MAAASFPLLTSGKLIWLDASIIRRINILLLDRVTQHKCEMEEKNIGNDDEYLPACELCDT